MVVIREARPADASAICCLNWNFHFITEVDVT